MRKPKQLGLLLTALWILWSRSYMVPGNDKISPHPDIGHIPMVWLPIEEFSTEQSCIHATTSTVTQNVATLPKIAGVERSADQSHPFLLIVKFREHITVIDYRCFPSDVYPRNPGE